ncbi:MAG: hypothetical protein AAF318_00725 [Pseudomonadota bacterium]
MKLIAATLVAAILTAGAAVSASLSDRTTPAKVDHSPTAIFICDVDPDRSLCAV